MARNSGSVSTGGSSKPKESCLVIRSAKPQCAVCQAQCDAKGCTHEGSQGFSFPVCRRTQASATIISATEEPVAKPSCRKGDPSMSAKPVRIPGPDHPITIERNSQRVVVKVADRIIADSHDALALKEASYPVVQYIPRKDVDISLLERTDHATYC